MAVATNDDAARWLTWERSYMRSSRRASKQARVAFAILLTGAAVWLGLQIMSMPA
jgi:hypothetical protein